ncbi:hypothetical protein KDAU_52000 [Dictyobacter aurantiacus]|uniref:Uncharacterized protein n=1 Tax=Dictyobacter aurantiacus TaxID=1936993 RepID=A0A401ZLW4_9CHLR|nr:hypothetical protein KDAU_52000 [Dictyobacter aurantiacus]
MKRCREIHDETFVSLVFDAGDGDNHCHHNDRSPCTEGGSRIDTYIHIYQ